MDEQKKVSTAEDRVDLNLERFAENLLQEKELANIDQETRDVMRADLVDRLEKVTNKVIVDSLPDDKLMELEALVDKKASQEELRDFVGANVPEIEDKLTDAYFDFRRLYLGL